MDLFKELMNRGYQIYETESGAVVSKTSTPTEPDTCLEMYQDIPIGSFPSSTKNFESYEEALAFCKKRIGWVDSTEPSTATNSNANTFWQMELMYSHRGLGLQSANLGEIRNKAYDEAVKLAEERATEYFDSFKDDVDNWEVRVRPCLER